MGDFHSFLFARPSFVEGAARLFDFGSTLNEYNNALSGGEADLEAIQDDWRTIGHDLGRAMQHHVTTDQLPDKTQ